MKRPGNPDSLGVFMSICPTTEGQSPRNSHIYSSEFLSMLDSLDEEACLEGSGQAAEKKRRLNVDQVKALEKNFEVENKLEPERKVKLAQELGLQPRQVAVWFQNRRARCKTKQLERDYSLLKSNYDSLKHSFDSLQRDNETLLKEIRGLKSKLNEENRVVNSEIENKVVEIKQEASNPSVAKCEFVELNFSGGHGGSSLVGGLILPDLKDGSSDSDSSAILNEGNSPTATISSSENGILDHNPTANGLIISSTGSSSMDCFQFSDSKAIILEDAEKAYQPQFQFVKIEEQNFFGGAEEPCNFFYDDQAPTLHWYCPDQWS